ncbi:MAG TPA: SDR family oxidoreductase [Rhodothermales bacterium]|nr:SDR family oxidoreductase [Rhodothermales bacterium]
MPDQNLNEKVVVITGASGRLGQRLVAGFAQHGATLAAIDLDADTIALPEGTPGKAFSGNVTQEEEVVAVFKQIKNTLGPVDVLLHTVGTWDGRPFLKTSLEDWQRLIDLNLTSAFLCFREAVRQMDGRGGRLIGIASGQGADKGRAEQAGYSASKAGVVRLVETLAEEFNGTGLTAHALAPSAIVFDENSDKKGVPVGDLVELALYLCTPAAASLNGATLRAYGTLR